MVAGVCCKLMNTLYFKDDLTMYFVYIPEMIFINSIFGYLVILILLKWTTNWDTTFVLNNEQVPRPVRVIVSVSVVRVSGCQVVRASVSGCQWCTHWDTTLVLNGEQVPRALQSVASRIRAYASSRAGLRFTASRVAYLVSRIGFHVLVSCGLRVARPELSD